MLERLRNLFQKGPTNQEKTSLGRMVKPSTPGEISSVEVPEGPTNQEKTSLGRMVKPSTPGEISSVEVPDCVPSSHKQAWADALFETFRTGKTHEFTEDGETILRQ